MKTMLSNNRNGKRLIQSVARTLNILNCFEKNEELQIAEISSMVGITKSTTHHLLATLKELNFIKQNPHTRGYQLGLQIFKLGYAYFNQLNLVKIARPYIKGLCEESRETVHLGELSGSQVLYLDKIEGPMSISMRSRIGSTKQAYCTGIGKILLAYQNDSEIQELLSDLVLEPLTENTITDKTELVKKLKEYRKQGYSIDNEEIEDGLLCIGSPIYDITGKVIAAISLSAPKYRIENQINILISKVMETASRISAEMGYSKQ